MSMYIPKTLANGRYSVGDLIGHGGMAEVHLGTDTRLGRAVAIKIMRNDLATDSIFLTRFHREARSVAQMNNPNIVAIYDSGEEHLKDEADRPISIPYIVMEYVRGRTLRDIIKAQGALNQGDAEQIMLGMLNALNYSHRMGIVHRDIKPGNIMISEQGEVKVMDFGIARALDDSAATMTQNQGVVGTAQYLSPEQARGETVDMRSDLYWPAACCTKCLRDSRRLRATRLLQSHISMFPKYACRPARLFPDCRKFGTISAPRPSRKIAQTVMQPRPSSAMIFLRFPTEKCRQPRISTRLSI